MAKGWITLVTTIGLGSAASAQLVSAQIDYPPAAFLAHAEGVVGYEVQLTPAGQVAKCHVLSSSGNRDLDHATCDQLRKTGRFKPGADAAGQPVASTYQSSMRWALSNP